MRQLVSMAIIAFLAGCVVPVPVPAPATASSADPLPTSGFGTGINAFRASQGLGPLREDPALARAAAAHAQDMLARNYFDHRAPNGPNGVTFVQRARTAGCAMQAGAENIASGQRSEAEALQGWINSPGHRRNMLGRSYTLYGLGRAGDIWVLKLASAC